MVYTPAHIDWKNDPDTTTPILAEDLEHIEAGIVAASQPASETVVGNVELASPAEMTAGTSLTLVPAVKRVADYVTAQMASVVSAATETSSGVVELATAAELTTGTDLTRPASAKRIADYVTTRIASIPGVTAATETVAGISELASPAEMTAGTDLTRVPAVKRVADYVIAAVAASATTLNTSITALADSTTTALAAKANIAGSVNQFADVEDGVPSDAEVLRYDLGVSQWRPYDLSGQFASVGVDGRLATPNNPQFYVPLLVINEGDAVPGNYPVNGIVLSRPLGGGGTSIVPALVGQNKATGGITTLAITLTDAVAVGDYLIFGVGTDATTTTGVLPTTHTFSYSSGAAAASAGPVDFRSGTVQSNIYYARCTTAIPSGATVTMTANQSRGHLQCTIAKVVGLFATIGTVVDRTSNTNNNNTALSIALPTTAATAQASELAIEVFAWNHAAAYPTPVRTLAPGSGWTQIGPINYSETSSFRSSIMAFRLLTSIGTVAGTATFTSTDGTTGPWAGVLATFKGA